MTGYLYAEIIRKCSELEFSTLVSYLYGLTRRILYVICITLFCNFNFEIDKKIYYHKWALIWRFVFLCSVVSEYDIISNFIVVIKSMSILGNFIFIYLRLIFLT